MSKITASEIKACFDAFDPSGNGFISKDDAATGVRALGKNPTEAEWAKESKAYDDNVNFSTFKELFGKSFPSPQAQDKPCRQAFALLDADNNGTIPEAELRQMLATVGDCMSHQEIDFLMEDVEVDDLGRVHFNKLVDLMITGCDDLIR